MKLTYLLGGIAVAWCLLGALVLGPGILLYPLAWGIVVTVLLAVHRLRIDRLTLPKPSNISMGRPANSGSTNHFGGSGNAVAR